MASDLNTAANHLAECQLLDTQVTEVKSMVYAQNNLNVRPA